MNRINISTTAAEKIIKHLQKYLIEKENFNVYISDKNMKEITELIDYICNKINEL